MKLQQASNGKWATNAKQCGVKMAGTTLNINKQVIGFVEPCITTSH